MQRVEASWVERFAGRLIQLAPSSLPLDAVRSASQTFEINSHLPPEVAAEVYVRNSSTDTPAQDAHH